MGELASSPKGPRAQPLPCPCCGSPVDPLRAGRVAILDDEFFYFCGAECHRRFVADPETRRPLRTSGTRPTGLDGQATREATLGPRHQTALELEQIAGADLSAELELGPGVEEGAISGDDVAVTPAPSRVPVGVDVSTLLLGLATVCGVLGALLAFAGGSSTVLTARMLLTIVATGTLAAEVLMAPRRSTELHPMLVLTAPVILATTAVAARMLNHAATSTALTIAELVSASLAASLVLMDRKNQTCESERELIEHALRGTSERVVGSGTIEVHAEDLRPGEEIVVDAGDIVPVDATIVAGSARVNPWFGTSTVEARGEGDPIVAGARVIEGRIRAVVGWAGHDRMWMRLTNDPRRRADLAAPMARTGRLLAERGAPILAMIAALMAFASNADPVEILLTLGAVYAALSSPAIAENGALHVTRTVLTALRRGVAFRSADALERASKVSSVTFCARGTLLLGEPELVSIETFAGFDSTRVLALMAGAESHASHPVASAVVRASRARAVRPDAVRSPTVQAGLGVTAVASTGEQLVVGSRALMLRERIAVARAEAKISDLEAMGQSVMLVALAGRLVGVAGVQDGLRPGARSAVQHLLDVGVEPVLLSGDSRETCEALGRTLDITHIRPEILPADRGEEVRRMTQGGAVVAVVGRSPIDDVALGAADLSVALRSAGGSNAEWSVLLGSDDVRDAAYAIRLAHQCRREVRLSVVLSAAPALFGTLLVLLSLAPLALAPLASFAGAVLAGLRQKPVA